MNWSFLIQSYPRIESTICAQHIQCSLSVVTLACLVYLRLCENDQGCAELIPFELDFVAFEEGFLRDRASELRNIECLDGSWLTLKKMLVH